MNGNNDYDCKLEELLKDIEESRELEESVNKITFTLFCLGVITIMVILLITVN